MAAQLPTIPYASAAVPERVSTALTATNHLTVSVPPPSGWRSLDSGLKAGIALTISADLLLLADQIGGAALSSQVLPPFVPFATATVVLVCVAVHRLGRRLSFEVTSSELRARSSSPFQKRRMAWPRSAVRDVRLNGPDHQLILCLADGGTFKISLGTDAASNCSVRDGLATALATVPPTPPASMPIVAFPRFGLWPLLRTILIGIGVAAAAIAAFAGLIVSMASAGTGLLLIAPVVLLAVCGVAIAFARGRPEEWR